MRSHGGSGQGLGPFHDLTCHLSEDPGFDLPGRERPDDGDELAVPGDEGWLASLFDCSQYAGSLLVEITYCVDEDLIVIYRGRRRLRSYW